MKKRKIDQFFATFDETLQKPARVILTGAACGAIYGNIRPSRDIDFEIQFRGRRPERLKLEKAVQNAVSYSGMAANYSEDIGHWSMIEYLDYRKKAVFYKQIGSLEIKLMAPDDWTIGKMTRFLAIDILDLTKVIRKKKLNANHLARLWGTALRKSALSEASGRFRNHVVYFYKRYGKKIWGGSFEPEKAVQVFKRSAGIK